MSASKTGTKTNAIPTKRTQLTLTLSNWFVDLTQIHKMHVLLPSFLRSFDHSRHVQTEPVQLYKLMFYSSLIRQKDKSQNGCFKKTKHVKFPEKRFPERFLTPHLRVHIQTHPFALLLTLYRLMGFFIAWTNLNLVDPVQPYIVTVFYSHDKFESKARLKTIYILKKNYSQVKLYKATIFLQPGQI